MDESPADLASLAKCRGERPEDLARELAELAEMFDEQEYEAFWEEAKARMGQTTPSPPTRKRPK